MTGINISVRAAGFSALCLGSGVLLLLVAFNYTKDPANMDQEKTIGYALIVLGFLVWFLSFASGFGKRRGHGRWKLR